MTEFRVVTADELKPVLDELNGLDWPAPFAEFIALFSRLGWEVQRRKGGVTSLPVSLRLVSVGKLDDEIASFRFRISDTLPDESPTSRMIVERAFPRAVDVVSRCLGFDPTGTPWNTPGARWELDGGRQLNLLRLDDTIVLQYWSKRTADIERTQRRLGVDPHDDLNEAQYRA